MTFSGQSALSSSRLDYTRIRIYKGRMPQFNIGFDGKGYLTKVEADPGNSISATWMMKLAKGNKIRLQSRNYLWIDHWNPLTFTGELIHISDDAKKNSYYNV